MVTKKGNAVPPFEGAPPPKYESDGTATRLLFAYLRRAALATGVHRGGSLRFAKLTVIWTNVAFMALGVVAVAIGISYKMGALEMAGTTVESQTCGFLKTVPSLLLVVGAGAFALAYAGCYGAYREDVTLLTVYALVLGVLFFAQAAVGVYAAYAPNPFGGLEREARNNLLRTYNAYGRDMRAVVYVDTLQRTRKCCGMYGAHCMRRDNGTFPDSCCDGRVRHCVHPYQRGCWPCFYDDALRAVHVISRILICLSVVELFELVLVIALTIAIVVVRRPVVI